MCHVIYIPPIPKIMERKRWELSCDTDVFQRRFVCMVQGQEQWVAVGRWGAGGAACCTSSPSARFGSLQALLLSFSHLLGFFYAFLLNFYSSWGRDGNICRDKHRQCEALRQYRFVWKTCCLSQCLIIYLDRLLCGSLSFSLAFSSLGYLCSSFTLACVSRTTSLGGGPGLPGRCVLLTAVLGTCLLQGVPPSPGHTICWCPLRRRSPMVGLCWHLRGVRPRWKDLGKGSLLGAVTLGSMLFLRPGISLDCPDSNAARCAPWRGLWVGGVLLPVLACAPAAQILLPTD